MKGNELAEAIKAKVPGQAIVLFTDYAEAVQNQGATAGGIDLILAKRLNLDDLRRTIANSQHAHECAGTCPARPPFGKK